MIKLNWIIIGLLMTIFLEVSYSDFRIGRGKSDITGVIAEGNLYGWGRFDHDARGLHTRQYARTFIICNDDTSESATTDEQCVVLVTIETLSSTQSLKAEVMDQLALQYGDLYTEKNVMIVATHTHAAPGGTYNYNFYAQPSRGFVTETFDLCVIGILESINQAHADVEEGIIRYDSMDVSFLSRNRSPYAYDQNPDEEKNRYESDVETAMHVIKMMRSDDDGRGIGMFNLFAVHPVSIRSSNHLVSTDNKGRAAQVFELMAKSGVDDQSDTGEIVGAFAQSALGDVTPNTEGDFCNGGDELCDYMTSTCPEDPTDSSLCNSRGPTEDMFENARYNGESQAEIAANIYADESDEMIEIEGIVESRHMWVDISDYTIDETRKTCKPAIGFSVLAGTTDGGGIKGFTQADTTGCDNTNFIDSLICTFLGGSQELRECQAPKPIAFPSGEISVPHTWQPEIIPMQLFKIGQIYLAGVPSEFTTMAGRRLVESIESTLISEGIEDAKVLLISLANGYSGYVTTFEEYSVQRYEGASTLYGPYTLDAYIMNFNELVNAMISGTDNQEGPLPPDLRGLHNEALGEIAIDSKPWGTEYGDIISNVEPTYMLDDTVSVTFIAGNPRSAAEMGENRETFLKVQRLLNNEWITEYDDSNWETRFIWESNCQDISWIQRILQLCHFHQQSTATITWHIDSRFAEPGIYRISHSGYAKTYSGSIIPYMGVSSSFTVTE